MKCWREVSTEREKPPSLDGGSSLDIIDLIIDNPTAIPRKPITISDIHIILFGLYYLFLNNQAVTASPIIANTVSSPGLGGG
jgi:hypothetical protein